MFDDEAVSGGGFSLPALGRLANFFPKPPSQRDLLEQRLLELRVAELERALRVVPWRLVSSFAELPGRDVVVLGGRGSGKTAFAVSLAQYWSESEQRPVYGVGWRDDLAKSVGVWKAPDDVWRCRDCVVLADEHSLIASDKAEMWRSYALGRQQGRRVISTSQSTAAIPPDVFRLGPTLVWRSVDALALHYEREEVQPIVRQAGAILASMGNGLERWVAFADGQWFGGNVALPKGWSDDVSQLWR